MKRNRSYNQYCCSNESCSNHLDIFHDVLLAKCIPGIEGQTSIINAFPASPTITKGLISLVLLPFGLSTPDTKKAPEWESRAEGLPLVRKELSQQGD